MHYGPPSFPGRAVRDTLKTKKECFSMEATARRVRELIEERCISKKRLAEDLQVSYSALNNYLNGRRWINLSLIRGLCQRLDTSADYLLGLSDEKRPYALPDDEQTLLAAYRLLPGSARRYLLNQMNQLYQLCRQLGRT